MLLRTIRSVFTLIKSQATPDQIALGAGLGLLVGLTPVGGHTLAILAVALAINCSFRAAILAALFSTPLKFALAGLSYGLGVSLLEGSASMRALASWLNDIPVVALSDFARYWMFGASAVALAIAVAAYVPLRMGVARYRRSSVNVAEKEWYKKLHRIAAVRWAHWLFIGGETAPEVVRRKPWHPLKYLRWQGLATAGAVGLLGFLGAAALSDSIASSVVDGVLARTLGVTARVGKVELSLLGGDLKVEADALPDRARPGQDVMKIGAIEGKTSVVALLTRRIVVDHLRLRDVSVDARRQADGSINLDAVDPQAEAAWAEAWRRWVEWAAKNKDKNWNEMAAKAGELWEEAQRRFPRPDPRALPFDPDLAAELAPRRPKVLVGELSLTNLEVSVADEVGGSPLVPRLKRTDLAVRHIEIPNLSGAALEIDFRGGVAAVGTSEVKGAGTIGSPDQQWTMAVTDVPLTELSALVEPSAGLKLLAGSAKADSRVSVGAVDLKGTAQLRLDGLKVAADRSKGLFGADAGLTPYIVDGINAVGARAPIIFAFTIRGTRQDPQVDWDVPWLQIAKEGMIQLGVDPRILKDLEQTIGKLSPEHVAAALTGDFETMKADLLAGKLESPLKTVEGIKEGTLPGKAIEGAGDTIKKVLKSPF